MKTRTPEASLSLLSDWFVFKVKLCLYKLSARLSVSLKGVSPSADRQLPFSCKV